MTIKLLNGLFQILKNVDWPEQFPFKKEDFQRFDEYEAYLLLSFPYVIIYFHLKGMPVFVK